MSGHTVEAPSTMSLLGWLADMQIELDNLKEVVESRVEAEAKAEAQYLADLEWKAKFLL